LLFRILLTFFLVAPFILNYAFAQCTGTTCQTCTVGGCAWCGNTNTCVPGSFSGPSGGGCGLNWYYSSCSVSGISFFIIIAVSVTVFLVVVGYCCCRILCWKPKKGDPFNYVSLDERASQVEMKPSAARDRRNEMREKYASSRNMN